MEVTNLRRRVESGSEPTWVPIEGTEQMILGDLSILADGESVEVNTDSGEAKSEGKSQALVPPDEVQFAIGGTSALTGHAGLATCPRDADGRAQSGDLE